MESHHKFTSKLISQKPKFYPNIFSSAKIRKLNNIENSDIKKKNNGKTKQNHHLKIFINLLVSHKIIHLHDNFTFMKILKILPFILIFWILFISWCEKDSNWWDFSCQSEDTCSIDFTQK